MIVRPSLGHVFRSSPSAQPAGFPLRRTATLAGAATLMLLLAACGGGSGGSSRDKAVSSSPTPPTNQAQNAGTGPPALPIFDEEINRDSASSGERTRRSLYVIIVEIEEQVGKLDYSG